MNYKAAQKWLKDSASEMKHFILGALVVIVLVLTVPFVAQLQSVTGRSALADTLGAHALTENCFASAQK